MALEADGFYPSQFHMRKPPHMSNKQTWHELEGIAASTSMPLAARASFVIVEILRDISDWPKRYGRP